MKEKLLNNLWLKILAIFLSFFVWLAVVNISNPEITGEVKNVPVEVRNESVLTSQNKTYKIVSEDSVAVSYRIRTKDAPYIRAADIKAYVDLSDLYSVTGAVPVRLEIDSRKEGLISGSLTAKPGVIHVETENMQRKAFALAVTTIGTPADDYTPGRTVLSPDTVYVNGPQSLVGQISKVGIEVKVSNASSDVSGSAPVIFYDANGTKLDLGEEVSVNYDEISYETTILKVKNLTLNFDVQGTVAEGYRFTGVESEIKSVPVVGLKSVLASIGSITVPSRELDISGAYGDRTVEVDISQYLPPSTKLTEDFEPVIEVTMKVEKLMEKTYQIPAGEVNLSGTGDDYRYEFDEENVQVTVQGLKEDLETLKETDIKASADVTGLEPGQHQISLNLELGEGFLVVKNEPVSLTVTADGDQEAMQKEVDNQTSENESKPVAGAAE